jgi:hypothetical protein
VWGSACRFQSLLGKNLGAPTKVTNAYLATIGEKHILGLEISVDTTSRVHVFHALQNLSEIPRRLDLWKPILWHTCTEGAQRTTGTILEDHVHIRIIFKARQELQNVFVPQHTLYSDLALQLAEHVSDVQWVLLNYLQRHKLTRLAMSQTSNYSESALTKELLVTLIFCEQLLGQLRRWSCETY